jgi:predicted small lipoprotein YifL
MTGTGKRMVVAALALLMVAGLSGCGRNKHPLTPCIGDHPAIERTKDVAPPNCPAG